MMIKALYSNYPLATLKNKILCIIIASLCLLLLSCGESLPVTTQPVQVTIPAQLTTVSAIPTTLSTLISSSADTTITTAPIVTPTIYTPTTLFEPTANSIVTASISISTPIASSKIVRLTPINYISETAILSFTGSTTVSKYEQDEELYLYDIYQNHLAKINDLSKVFKIETLGEKLEAGLSPDQKKIWIYANYDIGQKNGYVGTYWIGDVISVGNVKVIKPPAPPTNDRSVSHPLAWNSSSDGLIFLLETGFGIMDLQNTKSQILKTGDCHPGINHNQLGRNDFSWSNLNKEIYCYNQLETSNDVGVATITLKDSQFHFFKFAKRLGQEPRVAFSPNADYVAVDAEVYALGEVAFYNGKSPKALNLQPEFALQETTNLCPEDLLYTSRIQCPIWSSTGHYVLYEREKTYTEKIAEIYDTKLKKQFSYDMVLPDYPNLKYVTIAKILDSKNVILQCFFNDGHNDVQSYFLANLDASTIVPLSHLVDKLYLTD